MKIALALPGKKPLPARRRTGKQAPAARGTARAAAQGATRKPAAGDRVGQPRGSFRWLERIMILCAVGVVLAGGLKAWIALARLPVQQITVTGELENTQTNAIRDMVESQVVHGFIGADLGELSRQLQVLPWVYRASVRRVWPNSLEIHIDEQLPIARWGDSGFLNHQGQVFLPSEESRWESLPLLQGPEGSAPSLMRTYQRLVDLLAPLDLGVSQLVVDERGEMEAVLRGGQRLVIGGRDFLDRLQRFSSVYRAELSAQMDRVERIDLRYAHGVAVAFAAPVENTTPDTTEASGETGKV